MSDRWWRAYDRSRRDPKLQRLPAETFRGWFNLVCLASEGGGKLPGIADIAFELRKSEEAAARLLAALESAELFEQADGAWRPRKWNTLQYKSDVSTERVKRFRQRSETVPETPSENREQIQIAETEQRKGAIAPPAPKPEKTDGKYKLPADWQPSEVGRAITADLGLDRELTPAKFCDYYHNGRGKTERRDAAGWDKRYAIWCHKDAEWSGKMGKGANRPSAAPRGNDAYFDELAAIGNRPPRDEPFRN